MLCLKFIYLFYLFIIIIIIVIEPATLVLALIPYVVLPVCLSVCQMVFASILQRSTNVCLDGRLELKLTGAYKVDPEDSIH